MTSAARDRLDEIDFRASARRRRPARRDSSRWPTSPTCSSPHLAPDDPVAGYAARLADPSLDQRAARLPHRQPRPRAPPAPTTGSWSSTTRRTGSGPADEPLTAWHYRPEAVRAEMEAAHYPLQALLYTVALHRYLRWRVRGYDPEQHLAGVLLPVPAWHEQPGVPGRRRSAVRGVVVAAGRVARRGAERPLRPGAARASGGSAREPARPRRLRRPSCAGRVGPAARLQRGRRAHRGRRARGDAARAPRRHRRRGRAARCRLRRARASARPRLRGSRHHPHDGQHGPRGRPTSRAALAGRRRLDPSAPRQPARRRATGRCSWSGTTLYLDRFWSEERQVAADLLALADPASRRRGPGGAGVRAGKALPREPTGRTCSGWPPASAVLRRFSVIAGGPGTGKTTTVAAGWPCSTSRRPLSAGGAPARSPWPRRPERPPPGCRRPCTRRRCGDDRRPRAVPSVAAARRDASSPARLQPGQPLSLSPPPIEPPCPRRGRRRRDVDGVAVADGPARRGRASGRPADPRRRP